ncbi:hypothetical protein Tco_0143789 [Tanacetum coccineum]
MASASKDPLTFNNLMATHIDFFKYALNHSRYITFDPEVTYTTSITKTNVARNEIEGIEYMVNKFYKQNVYSTKAILGVKSVSANKLHGYGHLEEIVVKRSDQQLYKFKEGDFVDLHLNDIEDMLLLAVQHQSYSTRRREGERYCWTLCGPSYVHKKSNPQDVLRSLPLSVESYQKKLIITKPQKTFPEIEFKEPYTPSYDPPGIVYEDLNKQKRVL